MKKVVPLEKTIDKGRLPAEGTRGAGNGLPTIPMEFEDLFAELRDAQTVVDVATEAWGEENENSASSCVGVLDLLGYKLGMIEREAKDIMARARATAVTQTRSTDGQ